MDKKWLFETEEEAKKRFDRELKEAALLLEFKIYNREMDFIEIFSDQNINLEDK